MRVFAPVPFRWTDGIDYPYGWFDIADDSKARAMKAAGRVSDGVFDSPDDAITPQAVTYDPKTGLLYAGGVPVSVAGISSADLATTAGIAGAMYQLSDGPNKGAKLTWAIPEGATEPTWCWWLWPQAAYTA